MYSRRFSQSVVLSQTNLNYALRENSRRLFEYSFMFRKNFSSLGNIKDINKKFKCFIRNGGLYRIIFKPESNKCQQNVLKVWIHHCECVVAQRLRRYHQMFCLYSRLWEERALKEFISKMRQNLSKKGKEFALSAVGISAYNWDKNRISDDEIKKFANEFEYIDVLKENTICLSCDPTKRTNINTNICKCGTTGLPTERTYEEWSVFIEKTDLVVWRRLHHSGSGQYEYKVFGSYNDVSAQDFFNCQVDTAYRRTWDTTAVALEIAETDPAPDSNSDILYWEMLWPRLFVNRDYVFNRRYFLDEESNVFFIMSKSTEHPKFPNYPDKYRIEDYWSCMVIKPYTNLSEPGIEFSLTYYDNPGVNIPSSVTTWVAMRAMPDFLDRLRAATKKYREYCVTSGVSKSCEVIKEEERIARASQEKDKLDYCNFDRTNYNFKLKPVHPKPDDENIAPEKYTLNPGSTNETSTSKESSSIWKYFHPLYYFH